MLTVDPEQRTTAKEALMSRWLIQYRENNVSKDDMLRSLKKLQKFTAQKYLQKAVLGYFATQKLTSEEESKLRLLFGCFDADKDGVISVAELSNQLNKFIEDSTKAKEEAKKIMERVDLNKNGAIDYTEFLIVNLKIGKYMKEESLKEAFDFYDVSKTGKITVEGLRQVFGNHCDDATLQMLIKEGDIDRDGYISYNDFKTMMSKYNKIAISRDIATCNQQNLK